MKNYKLLLLFIFQIGLLQSTIAYTQFKESSSNNVASIPDELHQRGGVPNFLSKVVRGDSIKVAYLGGSITFQEGWRVHSLKWFNQRFPQSVFTEINAAIGGTGSDFGCFRMYDHVLKFNPDLVFVEFAVNDDRTPSERIVRSMESIVRQAWKHNPKTDICFVYTIKANFLETEQRGQLPESAKRMEEVASKYHIPAINFGFEVARQVKDSQLIFKGKTRELDGLKCFSPDGVHPYPETGHIIYLEVLKRSFEKMISDTPEHFTKHDLGEPLASDFFAHPQMIGFTEVERSKNWEILKVKETPSFSSFGKYLLQVGKAGRTGENLSFKFKGSTVGAFDIMGYDAGRVIVEIDGEVKDTLSRFDSYCTYRRMRYFLIDHLENKVHSVTFRVLCTPFDKAAILTKREDITRNPDKYTENNWYIGKILLDGELIPRK
tara:strand:+ start:22536 stop:23837 length:1302 start_codon:yes stop_codon:yes gene_type:complete